ncbi:MAG: LysR family transcriptional regulator [Pirellulaceae bacterium]
MEFDQLRYFLQVAQSKSFTRAAEELGISQPALSRAVQKLEEELGVPVLVRKTRVVELTDAGLTLRSRAEQILSIAEDTKAEISDDGRTGRLRIGAIPTIAPYFLPHFLKQFSSEFPEAQIEIYEDTTKNLLRQCSQGEVDMAVMALPVFQKYLEVSSLFSEELWLALPKNHSLVDAKNVRLKDLENYTFVMLDEPHCLSDNILSFCRQRSFQPVVIGRANQLSMVQELVALGHGISMVPDMARRLDKSKARVYRSLAGQPPTREVVVTWDPYRFQSRLAKRCRERLTDFCQSFTAS